MVFVISAGINRLAPSTAQILFWVFAALMGVSLSSIFLVFTHTSIVRVFFITAATFGALSLYGYTTKRDMSGMGSFLFMGLIGIVIASLVNLFLASSVLQFVVSVVGVLVFAGLTAWDTQRLKNDYIYGYASAGGDIAERAAITGALSLYLNFINLFTLLLQLLGQRGLSAEARGRTRTPAERPGFLFGWAGRRHRPPCAQLRTGAGDPVRRSGSVLAALFRSTGCPAYAGHDSGEDGGCFARNDDVGRRFASSSRPRKALILRHVRTRYQAHH
ncbi:FtsH-binding integral membrane protein [Bradyrhizobium sp. F1.13.1]